jgi:N-acetyl-gamma-glutamyl-phosphate reductase
MLKVAILGGSGYTGSELLRLLLNHPHVKITSVTSERLAGTRISDVFLNIRGTDLTFEHLSPDKLQKKADLFILCLPHKTSQEAAANLYKSGKKVIDLSADYRLRSAAVYEKWYKTPHKFKSLLNKAVYGLPEIYKNKIKTASLIANPGCYPTGAILGLAPVISQGLANIDSIIIDSKSGVSGAGRSPALPFMFSETNESVKAYAVASHRHTPEIEQELSLLSKKKLNVIFTPHLMPMDRGILSTIYVRIKGNTSLPKIQGAYQDFYKVSPFVRVLKDGVYPATKAVKGSNYCDISAFLDRRKSGCHTLIIITAIDNLLKGASGQAVQNMNIMYGFEETAGLTSISHFP